MQTGLKTVLLLVGMSLILGQPCAWAHTDVTVDQARDLVDSTDDLIVVDVREPSEYCDARGHIPGAVNYPLNSGVLQVRYEELPKDAPVLVVCRSGGRSNVVATFLDGQGFSEVYDMMGGMNAWTGQTERCKYSGGSGAENDPYQIATATDLITLGETPDDYDKHFILTADIDFGRRVFDRAVIAPDTDPNWLSGFDGRPFSGAFDGNGHTISNLTITGHDYLGLFGQLQQADQADAAGITSLRLEAVSVTGSGADVGGLVGHNDGVTLSHSSASGEVSGGRAVGGLVGFNGGRLINCHGVGTVSGDRQVGGLAGWNYSTLTSCYNHSTVDGVLAVGGMVGFNDGTVTQSYSTGVVSGGGAVGGLIGQNGAGAGEWFHGDVDRSYSLASVNGNTDVGGLVGDNQGGTVHECYSAGVVSGSDGVGGLVGSGAARDVTASFWDTEASGLTVSSGGEGQTTAQMQTAVTFVNAGWDFTGRALNGLHEIWQMPEQGGYPILSALNAYVWPELQGQGTGAEPYLIASAAELGAMIHYDPNAHYRLTATIDLSGIRWRRDVIPRFGGTFDGGGHTISHLTIQSTDSGILIGRLDAGGTVKDLAMVDVNIVGLEAENVGGLVGYNEGRLTRCYSTGSVDGFSVVGGLVGYNRGEVTRCYSLCAVNGTYWVGGLVGVNSSGMIQHCYSTGAVYGFSRVGGLISSSTGTVAECFWDIENSGRTTSAGGTGLARAEMQTAGTYLEAGWDFMGETANGTDDIWWILEGQDCPRLRWELGEETGSTPRSIPCEPVGGLGEGVVCIEPEGEEGVGDAP
jgi:rhodanese-related sulfurtransferase